MKSKIIKWLVFIILVLLSVLLLFVGCGKSTDEGDVASTPPPTEDGTAQPQTPEDKPLEQKFISIGTGGTGGTYFVIGAALADLWTRTIPYLQVNAEVTGAGVENTRLVHTEAVEVGYVDFQTAYQALSQVAAFEDEKEPIVMEVLATIHYNDTYWLSIKGSGIETMNDIRGKRVAVGAPGSGTELSKKTKLPKSTISRLVNTLELHDYLGRNPKNRKCFLGTKIINLGLAFLNRLEIKSIAYPIMMDLKEKCSESVYISIIFEGQRLCLETIPGNYEFSFIPKIGKLSNLYVAASSKVILAFASPKIKEELEISSELNNELFKIRTQGYAISYGELHPGVTSVSTPIFNYTGEVEGSLSIALPLQRASKEKIQLCIKLLKKGSMTISKKLGYNPK